MKGTRWILIFTAALLAMGGFLLFFDNTDVDSIEPALAPISTHDRAVAVVPTNDGEKKVAPTSAPTMATIEDEVGGPTFRVDAAGNLIIDEKTRDNIERLVALTDPSKLYDATREKTKDLPPAAAQRAEELVDRFVHYQQAQKQAYPPGTPMLTEDDALRELEGLQALRAAHFGADVAKGFYGAEEKLARELIELMRLEKEQGLTLEEKADRAQRLRSQLPNVSALEQKNRDTAAAIEARGQER